MFFLFARIINAISNQKAPTKQIIIGKTITDLNSFILQINNEDVQAKQNFLQVFPLLFLSFKNAYTSRVLLVWFTENPPTTLLNDH